MFSNFKLANRILKKIKLFSKSLMILGGNYVTEDPNCLLNSDFNIGVVEEGEKTFLNICLNWKNKKSLLNIPGSIIKNKNKIISFPPEELDDLNKLPFPDRSLLKNIYLYKPGIVNVKELPCALMFTSRNCPYECIYCNVTAKKSKYKEHSSKYVLAEMEYLINKFKIRNFWISDDMFTLNKKRIMKLCKAIYDKKLNINWSCMSRVDTIDSKMLNLMKKAGCWQIDYGIESGNQKILDLINKKITLPTIRTAISETKKLGIKTKGFFIIGSPGETKSTINDTIKLACELDLDSACFFSLSIIKGSKLYGMYEDYGFIDNHDGLFLKQNFNLFIPKSLTKKELVKLQKTAYFRFYFRLSYIIKQLISISSLQDLKNKFLGLTSFIWN